MNHTGSTPTPQGNPSICRHRAFFRVGIQRAPVAPFRLYLLTCKDCGTTLTTLTIRRRRESRGSSALPSPSLEEDTAVARRSRRGA